MTKRNGWRMGVAIYLLCLATAIAAPAQTFKTLAPFEGTNGANPLAGMVQGADGNFYGTTNGGGTNGSGTVFKITAGRKLTTLYNFGPADGAYPNASLVLATDGNFYGTTYAGGANCAPSGCGTVFKITPQGTLTTLYSFCARSNCNDGANPVAGLIQAADGNLYGTTLEGGNPNCFFAGSCGTVFRITLGGKLTTLHRFDFSEGAYPSGPLLESGDGNFYGTAKSGGTSRVDICEDTGVGCGTIFKMTPGGTVSAIYSFCPVFQCSDGTMPSGGLIQASDGNFYGTTSNYGDYGGGTVFNVTAGGTLTTLYSFCAQPNCIDGAQPQAGVIQATDGNFYGTSFAGGANDDCGEPLGGCGTLFELTPQDTLTTLYRFCARADCSDGSLPEAVFQATDGKFYGTTAEGGVGCTPSGCGTIFSLDMGLSPFVAFVRAAAKVGGLAEVLGQGLVGVTQVSFNGVPASFTVRADTFLTATVPAGATTGYVTVTTPSGVLTSNVQFNVLP